MEDLNPFLNDSYIGLTCCIISMTTSLEDSPKLYQNPLLFDCVLLYVLKRTMDNKTTIINLNILFIIILFIKYLYYCLKYLFKLILVGHILETIEK